MITEETVKVLDKIEMLGEMIGNSDLYDAYRQAEQALEADDEAHLLYQAFLKSKESYDEVMRFGKYHPDYQKEMMDTRKRKRAYEMLPVVMDFKQKEMALQTLVDEVITKLAHAVSQNVKIEAGNPFFQKDVGGCSTGGSCNCSI